MHRKYHLNGKEINLTSDDVVINSNNFNVDKQGNMSCKNGTFTGGEINLSSTGDNDIKFKIEKDISNYMDITPRKCANI